MERWIPTLDIVSGDVIRWTEAVWPPDSWSLGKKARPIGTRTVVARVASESYGQKTQQHTFTLIVVASDGCEPLTPGQRIMRKGRNLYREVPQRLLWDDEQQRQLVAQEKHQRGDAARRKRQERQLLTQ